MPWTGDTRPSRWARRDVTKMDPDQVEVLLGEWYFREDKHGDVRGWTEDGRKTPLKTAKDGLTGLQHAQNAALNGDWLCGDWPNCHHLSNGKDDDSVEACIRDARSKRAFRGRREYTEV